LLRHGPLLAALFDRVGNVTLHFGRARSLLLRISEHTQPLEAGRTNELQQRLKILLRLAGEPDDESGAQGDAGDAGPNAGNEIDDILP